MKKGNSNFLRRHFILTSISAIVFSLIIFIVFTVMDANRRPMPRGPIETYYEIIKNTPLEYRDTVITSLKRNQRPDPYFKLIFLKGEDSLKFFLKSHHLSFDESLLNRERFRVQHFEVLAIDSVHQDYMVVSFSEDRPIHPIVMTLIVVIFVIIFTAMLSTILTYRSFGKFYANVRGVIDQIKSGRFEARFDIARNDEVGQSMFAFNEMAQEIEKYVTKIKDSESNRIKLLQELAHDLRTPIASLKNTIGTLNLKRDRMSIEDQNEFYSLALNEIDYFEKLVEDLLFLAKMSEPKYEIENKSVNLKEMITEEVSRFKSINKNITLYFEGEDVSLMGDAHLLKRLIRNSLENAVSFAHKKIDLKLIKVDDQILFSVSDDGPGFSEKILKEFGKRKMSRYESAASNQGRVSVGLGSVIMLTIAELHHGNLLPSNILDSDYNIVGGKLEISFLV